MSLEQERIFVQIASYRDRECRWTIQDLFEKAKYPQRIFVGVCWQELPEEDSGMLVLDTRPEQVRVSRHHINEAQGLGWARQQAMNLWQGEEYLLQIDSHMRFVQDWDEKVLDMLELADSASPVLTVYPPSYTPPNTLQESPPLYIQAVDQFLDNGVLNFTARHAPDDIATDKPFPTACLAGGFIFGPSRIIDAIKPDPGLYFFGEEVSLAVRLWTHGFDLFSPNQTVIYHYYERKEGKRHWNDSNEWGDLQQRSLARVRQMLEPGSSETFREKQELGPYGLGTERSLAAYEKFSGVNFSGKTLAKYTRSYPFVLDDSVAKAILAESNLTLSSHAHLFIIDDEGVVFSELTGDFVQLNTCATYVWCLLEEGAHSDEVVQGVSELLQTTTAQAQQMIAGLLTHWQDLHLLTTDGQEQSIAPLAPNRWSVARDAEQFPPAGDSFAGRHYYRLLDCVVSVDFATPEHMHCVHPVLSHLQVEATEADHSMSTGQETSQEMSQEASQERSQEKDKLYLYVDGQGTDRCNHIEELAPLVKFRLLALANQGYDYLLNLHAGAVSNGESCLLLPAAAGSGKTTLTAALVDAGYKYFSDETALLERDSCEIRPTPLALSVKSTGRHILQKRYPQLTGLPVHDRADGKRVQYLTPPAHAIADPDSTSPVSNIVVPSYRENAQTTLTRLSLVEALGQIFEHSTAFKGRLSLPEATTLIDWLRKIDCYALSYSCLDDAVQQIGELIAPPEQPAQ